MCQILLKELLQRHKVHDHKSLGLHKGTHYLKSKKYHGVFIDNIYCNLS